MAIMEDFEGSVKSADELPAKQKKNLLKTNFF